MSRDLFSKTAIARVTNGQTARKRIQISCSSEIKTTLNLFQHVLNAGQACGNIIFTKSSARGRWS